MTKEREEKMLNNKKHYGKARIESILVMLVLVVFSISTYTLVVSTASSYDKNHKDMLAKDNLRLALSYIDLKVKQSAKKGVYLIEKAIDNKDVIVVEDEIKGEIYQNVIYFKDGFLKEMLIKKGTDLSEVEGFEIAKIKDMTFSKTGSDLINVSITTDNEHGKKYTSNTIINPNF